MQISRINSYTPPIIANKNATKIARIDNNQIKADTVQFSGNIDILKNLKEHLQTKNSMYLAQQP